MEMRKCNVCGEMYSTTYRTCPFCEEEAALRRGKPLHRSASDYRNRRGGHALGILLLVVVLILAGWGIFRLWGDSISSALGIRETPQVEDPVDEQPGGDVTEPDTGDSGDVQMPGGDVTEPDDTPPDTPVALSNEDITISTVGQAATLTVSGGSGAYTWSSDNEAVATVDANGVVTAVSGGSANITVSDGYTSAVCIVRVSGGSSGQGTSTGGLTLDKEDITLNSTWPTYTFTASGASGTITWSSSNTNVATVDANGTVTRVGSGTCTITASTGSQTATCIVRVP